VFPPLQIASDQFGLPLQHYKYHRYSFLIIITPAGYNNSLKQADDAATDAGGDGGVSLMVRMTIIDL
jgi:hypothetical protein